MRTRWLAGLAIVAIADTGSGHENEEIEEIVVHGRWEKVIGPMVSASQGIVGQAELDLRPRLRSSDILEAVPGLVVTQHSGSGKAAQMFLRGFNLDHGTDFATWIDGMPINMPTHGHGQGYTDLNFIIPELIETLEFMKGPYYAEVSDFSSAGAANFNTVRRLENGFIKAGVGKDGFGKVLFADSFETGTGDLLVGLQSHRYDGPWIGVSEDLSRHNALLRYSESKPDEREWDVTLMAYDAEWNSADQVPRRAVTAGLISELGTIDDTVGGKTSRYSLSGRWHQDRGHEQFTARGYVIGYELDLFSNFTYFLSDPVDGDQIEQLDDRLVYGGDLHWSHSTDDRATHNLGANFRYDDISAVALFQSVERRRTDTVRKDAVRQLSAGLFYDYDWVWNESFRGTLGARADFYRFDVRDSNIRANAGTASDWTISPKLNIVRTFSEYAEGYFSAGLGFHSNDARGATISIDPITGDPAAAVDPLVQSAGSEIGFRFFLEDRVNLAASLWYLTLDSELLFVGDAGNTEVSRPSRRFGIEIPAYFRLNDVWMVDAEIALTDSKFTGGDAGGDAIPGSLDTVFAAGVSASFLNGTYGSLRLRHFGERPLIEDRSVLSSTSSVWNLGLGYRQERFDIRLEILNLSDSNDDDIAYYYSSRLPGEPSAGVDDVHFHPMEPRTYRLHFTWFYSPQQ